jgi:hypothetical protein
VAAPASLWGFAEGATGDVFDTYLLLANPHDEAVDVDVQFNKPVTADYPLANYDIVTRSYRMAPRSRRTVWIAQEDPRLAATAFSMTVAASAPIVAERTMWWPGSSAETWRESHTEGTIGSAGLRWAVADIRVDAEPDGWDTFLLIDSPPALGPRVSLELACDDGTRIMTGFLLRPYRVTLWLRHEVPQIIGKRCGAVITSLPRRLTMSPLVPEVLTSIQVEKAMYRGGFAAGSASMATRLPDPP